MLASSPSLGREDSVHPLPSRSQSNDTAYWRDSLTRKSISGGVVFRS
nr:MAG TPA: hypothetical protein [Caudoviricetes sp.]